jgi:hypothetical protein
MTIILIFTQKPHTLTIILIFTQKPHTLTIILKFTHSQLYSYSHTHYTGIHTHIHTMIGVLPFRNKVFTLTNCTQNLTLTISMNFTVVLNAAVKCFAIFSPF